MMEGLRMWLACFLEEVAMQRGPAAFRDFCCL